MNFKYFFGWIYWKLIYQHEIANKIYSVLKAHDYNELKKLLAEWRDLRTKYDGAIFDEKGYWIGSTK